MKVFLAVVQGLALVILVMCTFSPPKSLVGAILVLGLVFLSGFGMVFVGKDT